jgi:hypothetical protein
LHGVCEQCECGDIVVLHRCHKQPNIGVTNPALRS